MEELDPELLIVERGGDNLAAQYSRELADSTVCVIDVAGGDKVPRKGGPGLTQSDLLVINKTDLAAHVGADLGVMERDARKMRAQGPFVFTQVLRGVGVEEVAEHLLGASKRRAGASAREPSSAGRQCCSRGRGFHVKMGPLMRVLLLSLFTAMLFASGCSHTPVVYPPASPIYYTASFETRRTTEGGELPLQSDVLAEDAAQLLKPGRKVAFLPPDSCTTESVSPSGTSQNSTSILMRCGALLASLEAEVAKSGYSVVSWQALKSTGAAGSQERARAMGVNILFEVNQLSQESREPGARQVSNLRFGREDGPGRAVPVPVVPAVAERCAQQISGLRRAGEREYLATVNLKAVEVATGRALWLFQNTVVEQVGQDEESQTKLYYRADGVRAPPPGAEDSTLRTFGEVLATGGAIGFGVGGLLSAIDEEEPPSTTPGDLMLYGGLSAGVGVAMIGLDYLLTEPDRTVPAPVYPSEEQVLCASAPQPDPWAAPPPVAAAPTAQYMYTFTKATTADRDFSRERAERLTRKSTEDFVRALLSVARR